MIVCTRADFFARAIKFGGKEVTDGKIDLPEDDPAIVALLITYLYEGEYEPRLSEVSAANRIVGDMSDFDVVRTDVCAPQHGYNYSYDFPHTCVRRNEWRCGPYEQRYLCPHHTCQHQCNFDCQGFICTTCTRPIAKDNPEHLLIHAKMYEVADKYDVVGLKDLSKEKFKLACAASWNDAAFSIAAHHAFSTTMEDDKGLRDIVSGTISDHMELIRKPEVQALMTEFNGLSLGILMNKADEYGWGVK